MASISKAVGLTRYLTFHTGSLTDPSLVWNRVLTARKFGQPYHNWDILTLPPEVQLCLAAGKIASQNDRQLLHDHFKKQGWILWDDNWIRKKLQQMSYLGYEDEPSTIVAKLLLRTET